MKELDENYNIEEEEAYDEKLTGDHEYSYISDINITQYKSDIGFKTLIEGFDQFLYVIPRYQRKFIWGMDQVQNLAVSLIRGLPIPPIYVYRNEKNQLEILDGQQRMLSLFLYYKGKYLRNKETPVELQQIMNDNRANKYSVSFEELLEEQCRLKNVKYVLKYMENTDEKSIDITYNQLPIEVKRKVDFTTISVVEIKVDAEKQRQRQKNRIFYKVFENLNSAGTPLTNQELRNGVYQCDFYDMLHEINNENTKWREVYGEKHKHSRDIELLLRFSATEYYFKLEGKRVILNNYHNSYAKLLNDFSDEAINFSQDTIDSFRNNIVKFIDRIEVDGKIPSVLLESLYFASININGDYTIDSWFYKMQLNDKSILRASASSDSVRARLEYVYEKLSEYVEGNR